MTNKTAVIGFLGTTLDNGFNAKRWQRWRPTVSICLHDDLLVDELHILYNAPDKRLFNIVVDDIAKVSSTTQVFGHQIDMQHPWDFADVYAKLYDFVADFKFSDDTDYLLHLTTGTHVAQICWFLLVEAGFMPADFIQTSPCPKPDKNNPQGRYQVIDLDVSRYDSLRERFEAEKAQHWQTLQANLITQNKAYQQLIEDIEKVATRSSAPILLMGATGAGKSQLAAQIYAIKKAKANSDATNAATPKLAKFVAVNCATLRGDTAMSVLFGHVKGAFTGAAANRDGLLKSADGGVLFLDEIGELGLDEQAMLLTALEEQRFYPLGSDSPVTVLFQLMAGTNKDLRQAVAQGKFRADLFARVNTWTFFLPSLKNRLEDLPTNIDYELARIGSETQHQYRFEKQARKMYEQFATSKQATWSGNFRDLAASITRLTTLTDSKVIQVQQVQAEIARLSDLWSITTAATTSVPAIATPTIATGTGTAKAKESDLGVHSVGINNSSVVKSPSAVEYGYDTRVNTGAIEVSQIELASEAVLAQVLQTDTVAALDPVAKVQLAYVISICRQSKNQAAAGRYLYANARRRLKNPNDSDRLRKYLLKFGLTFNAL